MKIYTKGFTALELIIVIAIIGILTIVVLVPFSDFRAKQILNSETKLVESLIQEARSKTLASENDNQFGLYFESGQVTRFTGSDYVAGNADNKVFALHNLVELETVGLTDNELIFDKISGQASEAGSITISLVADGASSRTILVNESGVVSLN